MARFYKHIFSSEIIAQRAIASEVTIEQKIDDFGIAKLEIPIIPGIEEDCKIELYEVGSGMDLLVFSGFIYETQPIRKRWSMMHIMARDQKAIMQKRKALKDWDWGDGVQLSKIMEELLGYYNNNYQEQWLWSTFAAEVKLEIQTGDTYSDIFDEICEKLECFWTIKNNKVIFTKQLGKELRSTLIYDGKASNPGNISEIISVGTATACNIVLVEDRNGKKTINSEFFDSIISGVGAVSVRNGDIQESAQLKAKKLSKRQRKYQVKILDNSINAEIGDIINLDVRNTNHYFNFQGKVIIHEKAVSYANATKKANYTVGEELVYPYSLPAWQQSVNKEIRLLKLKNMA